MNEGRWVPTAAAALPRILTRASPRSARHQLTAGERRPPPARVPRGLWVLRGFAFVTLLAGVGGWLYLADGGARQPAALTAQIDQWLVAQGLGIEQISLEGHRYTPDADIFDALDLVNAGSMLRFSGTDAANRILRLPWVQRVQIRPLVPNGLHVIITERTPYAVWEHDGRHHLIDKTGHRLTTVGATAFADLPRVRGEGAPTASADLHATLSLFPAIAGRLERADRIGGRRWTLQLTGGITVQLPAEHEAAALQTVAALQASHHLLDRAVADIDVRSPGLTLSLAPRTRPAEPALQSGDPQSASGAPPRQSGASTPGMAAPS